MTALFHQQGIEFMKWQNITLIEKENILMTKVEQAATDLLLI
ncbi:unnamed protein product [Nezara viridula]|uniref:Uncharacterized protein n=1 Tax=Nezara viridula TaxID=85310 RepID=A0A9P0HUU7_NEZVI|nr:unnamed protein product [Nezara viridula]